MKIEIGYETQDALLKELLQNLIDEIRKSWPEEREIDRNDVRNTWKALDKVMRYISGRGIGQLGTVRKVRHREAY